MMHIPPPPLSLCDPSDPYVAAMKEVVKAIRDLTHGRDNIEFAGVERLRKGSGEYEIVIKFKDINPALK